MFCAAGIRHETHTVDDADTSQKPDVCAVSSLQQPMEEGGAPPSVKAHPLSLVPEPRDSRPHESPAASPLLLPLSLTCLIAIALREKPEDPREWSGINVRLFR